MAMPSTQRLAHPPAGSTVSSARSVREIIDGISRDVIYVDSDDDNNRPSPAPSEVGRPPVTHWPPPPPPPPMPHQNGQPLTPRRSTRARVPRQEPSTRTTRPEPTLSATQGTRSRKRAANDDVAPGPAKRSRVENAEGITSAASGLPRASGTGTLRTAVGASRLDDPSFLPSGSTTAKRKRVPAPDTQNKTSRSAINAAVAASAAAAAGPATPSQLSALPAVAASYPIPPVPATATTRPPLTSTGWNASSTNRSRPRPGAAAGLPSNVVSPDAPSPPQAGVPVDDAEGHFIVRPGDFITNRFKILSQLGQGTFGKVVECFDRTERTRVAIKIIRAVQKYRDASQIEIRVLKTLRENDPKNENRCIHLVSTFDYKNHVCIVSELLSKSIFDFLKDNEFHSFPSAHVWSFAKQLLKSVAFLHSLQLVHTDLKPENILLEDTDYVTRPYSSRTSNSKRWKILKNTALRLIDFGSATFNDEYHSAVVSTRHYRAPEIMLGMGWSFPCDAWSIGCILIEFHTGDALFQTHDNLEHLAMMETVLGPMPDDFRTRAERYKPEFFRSGKLNFPNSQTSRNSSRFVRGMKRISDTITYPTAYQKHNLRFLHLLRRLLEYDPTKRITVHEALKHPYFDLSANEFPP